MADPTWDNTTSVEPAEPKWEETAPMSPTAAPSSGPPPANTPWLIQAASDAVQAAADPNAENSVTYGVNHVGRNIPVLGPAAVKAGHGLAAFLSSITPDSALPPTLRNKTIGELYDHFKAQDDATEAALMKENPKAAVASGLAGGAALGNPLAMEAGAGANLFTKVGTGLVNAGTYGELLKSDAALKGAPADQAEHVGDVAAEIGSIVPGAQLLGAGAKAVAPAVADFAENRAASALGMTKGIRNRIGNDAAQAAGRAALDEGVVTPLASTEEKLARAQALQEKAGGQIGGVMNQLDQAGVKAFSPGDAAMQVESELGPTYAGEPLFKGLASQYDNLIDTILKRGDQPISFADAQALKEMLGQYGYKEGVAVAGREQAQRAYGIINQALDNAVESGAKQLPNSPELLDTLQMAKSNYQAAKNMTGALENKLSAEKGNRFFGLTDTVAGSAAAAAGGLMHGGPGAAMVAGGTVVGKKVAEKYGQNIAAAGADWISKALAGNPAAFGPFAPALQTAAQQGPQQLAVTHYLFSQRDPAYQALMQDVASPKEDSKPAPHQPAE